MPPPYMTINVGDDVLTLDLKWHRISRMTLYMPGAFTCKDGDVSKFMDLFLHFEDGSIDVYYHVVDHKPRFETGLHS